MLFFIPAPILINLYDSDTIVEQESFVISLIYIYKGTVSLSGKEKRTVGSMNLIVISSDESRLFIEVKSEQCLYSVIQLSRSYAEYRNRFYEVCLSLDTTRTVPPGFINLNYQLLQLIHAYFSEGADLPGDSEYVDYTEEAAGNILISLTNQFVDMLLNYNETISSSPDEESSGDSEAMRYRKLRYRLTHRYHNEIRLNDLAGILHFSPQYTSVYIHRKMGLPLKDLVARRRMIFAVSCLRYTKLNITQIILASGFPDAKTFNRLFAEQYGTSPLKYRRRYQASSTPFFCCENRTYELSKRLYQEILDPKETPEQTQIAVRLPEGRMLTDSSDLRINYIADLTEVRHVYDIHTIELLTYAKRFVLITHARFHIMESDREFWNKDIINIENACKVLSGIDIKPRLVLRILQDNDAEEALIALFTYLKDRYDKKEMEEWQLECTCPYGMLGKFNREDMDLIVGKFTAIFSFMREHFPFVRIGIAVYAAHKPDLFGNYICDALKAQGFQPDYTCVDAFLYEPTKSALPQTEGRFFLKEMGRGLPRMIPYTLSGNPDAVIEMYKKSVQAQDKLFGRDLVKCVNIGVAQYTDDILNEAMFPAAFVMKGISSLYDTIQEIQLPCLSDRCHFMYPGNTKLLKGTYSLFTDDGIPKPVFFAFGFLNQLNGQLLSLGSGHLAAINNKGQIYILLFRYVHPELFFCSHPEAVTMENRNKIFPQNSKQKWTIRIESREHAVYLMEEQTINSRHGSIVDLWGMLNDQVSTIASETAQHIRQCLKPSVQYGMERTEDGVMTLDLYMEIHEIKLIKLTPVQGA